MSYRTRIPYFLELRHLTAATLNEASEFYCLSNNFDRSDILNPSDAVHVEHLFQ
jgi:hypothetical protein